MTKVIQIAATADALYALDSDGVIWVGTSDNIGRFTWDKVDPPKETENKEASLIGM